MDLNPEAPVFLLVPLDQHFIYLKYLYLPHLLLASHSNGDIPCLIRLLNQILTLGLVPALRT